MSDNGSPRYGIIPIPESESYWVDNLERAQDQALRTAAARHEACAVVQLVGYAEPTVAPARWTPSTPVFLADAKQIERDMVDGFASPAVDSSVYEQTAFEAESTPESVPTAQPTPSPEPTAEQGALRLETAGAPRRAEGAPRTPSKNPAIRGVTFPQYVDVVADTGEDGPVTAEQTARVNVEVDRLKCKLNPTVTGWVGIPWEQINSATAECVIRILSAFQKS